MCFIFIDRGQLESSVGEEKRFNPRLTKDIDTFVDIMEHLNLPKPKMIGKLILSAVCYLFSSIHGSMHTKPHSGEFVIGLFLFSINKFNEV